MKKIALLALLLLSFSAVSAFAWTAKTYDPGSTDGTVTVGDTGPVAVKVSKGVSLAYDAETTAGLGYSVGAYHSSGTKTFASSSGDSKIWFTDATGSDIPDAPSGTDSADFGTGWTAL